MGPLPVPAPDVPAQLKVLGDAIIYIVAIVGFLTPAFVAMWIKLRDIPRLRATNHAIANSVQVTSLHAVSNSKKLDTLTNGLLTAVNQATGAQDASSTPAGGQPADHASVRPDHS